MAVTTQQGPTLEENEARVAELLQQDWSFTIAGTPAIDLAAYREPIR